MAKPHARAELEQARPRPPASPPRCGSRAARLLATRATGSPDRIGRRELQQAPGVGRQRVEPPPEALLDRPRERHPAGEPEPARQLRRRQPPQQLQQRQRVAARLADDLVAHPRVQRPGQHRVQQRARVVLAPARRPRAPAIPPNRRSCARAANTSADRLRLQAARHEREHLRRGAIEPLLVVHQADQRPLLGHVGEQAQDGQADEEEIRRRPGTDAERRPQRIALRNRQTLEAIEHRRQQLMQPGERELHLRLDTGGTRHAAIPTPARPRTPAAPSCPRPARHARTSTRLSPARTASISRSSTSHSTRRPRSSVDASSDGGIKRPSARHELHRSRLARGLATGGCDRAARASPSAHVEPQPCSVPEEDQR